MADAGIAASLGPAFEVSPAILAVSGFDDGRLVEVNEAFLRLTGFTREEVIGRPIPDLGLWQDLQRREEGLALLRAGRSLRDFEVRFKTKSGQPLIAIANADVVAIDGRRCIITALTDITARVHAEAALRESERRFAQAFHANPLPMSITSLADGRHLDVNDAAVRHSGYTRAEMLGRTKPQLGFWVAPEQRTRLLHVLHTEGRARDFEATFRTRAGEERHLLVNSEVITYAGQPAVLSVSVDITERKQHEAQQEARRAEAETQAQARDEFLAMLGHELRNPLATITNALGALQRRADTGTVDRLNAIIGRQVSHLTRLVDDLLDVARMTSGKITLRPQPVDLHELAGRCIEALAQAGRTGCHAVSVVGAPVTVLGDPGRLEQVVNNLIDNALKYTPAGGRVQVLVERHHGQAALTVEDTGEGIRPELLPRVFDLFVQEPQALDRSRGGLGLGLTLVKRLVELHGGSVSAASGGPGGGSAFTIRLPAADVSPAPGVVAPASGRPARRRRVLIVEDSADARESLRLLLELAGHEVETAADTPDALRKLEGFAPEVALIDLGLPGTDGYTLARLIRRRGDAGRLCLVAVTGYGQTDDRRRAMASGFDAHLTKPVDPGRLEEMLR